METGLSENILKAVRAVKKADKILIVAHVNPDGDTIGCLLALGLSLISLGKKVTLLSQDGIPTRFQFLPGSELILSETTETADVSIAVDCGSQMQLGTATKAFLKAKTTIQIDHHDFGNSFGKIQVLEEEAAAVGEIVFELIRALEIEITQTIATCLLTSIIVDTGSFRFSNIRPKTFDICSKLIRKGVDLRHLIEQSYWKKSRSMAKLSGHCIAQTRFSPDGKIAWSTVYQKDFKYFGALLSDVDAVADELRSIEGVKIADIFRETTRKRFRVSLRSSDGINVAQVAMQFGGGGHHNSAGCAIRNSEKEKQRLLDELALLAG
jgi:phosphoesterase RecJ-like protein